MYDTYGVGKRIASHRKEAGLTQEELAIKLGITAQAVSKWENGLAFPEITVLPLLANEFNTTIDELFGNDSPAINTNNAQLEEAHSAPAIETAASEKENKDLSFEHTFNNNGDEVIHKSYNSINSIDLIVNSEDFDVIESSDDLAHVRAEGSHEFIEALKIMQTNNSLSISHDPIKLITGFKIFMHKSHDKITVALPKNCGDRADIKISGSGDVNINIPFNNISGVIHGSGDIKVAEANEFRGKISGSGDINIAKTGNGIIDIMGSGDFTAENVHGNFKASIKGSGEVNLKSGELDSLDVEVRGSGDVNAKGITAKTANVHASGSGDIAIGRVVDGLQENCSGSGSVKVINRG